MSRFYNHLSKIQFKRKNVRAFLMFLLISTSLTQLTLFQNCGKIETISSLDNSSTGVDTDKATYSWTYGPWSSCSSPSCVTQTRTATCMKNLKGVITVESNQTLCPAQTQQLTQACSVTVPACGVVVGSCQNSGSPICNTSTGRMMQARMCAPSGATCSGGCPSLDVGACPVTPPPSSSGALFVSPVTAGTVDVTLYPQSTVTLNQSTNIVFGIPFPKGFVTDSTKIRVLNSSGTEIPSFVMTTTNWRDFQSPSTIISIKSVQIGIAMTFANTNPVAIKVQWGTSRGSSITNTFSASSTWGSMASGPNPTEYPGTIMEPKVYATLPPSWMSQSLLKTRFVANGEVSTYKWFDDLFMKFSSDATTTSYKTDSEPWLYDRAQTLYFAYFRSGDVNWLRRGHRAAQFYKASINSSGNFTLGGDAKYVYGQSMLYDLMLTGDISLVATIENTRTPHSSWPTNYSSDTNFWTERHAAYALLSSLAAFDATGAASDATRAKALFNDYFKMQQTPGNGWAKNGCTLHTHDQHDPDEDLPDVVCSPWMGALLTDAVFRYYVLSEDQNALKFLADYADYIHNYALTTEGGLRLPYYGASSYGNTTDGDIEHACDVMGVAVKGYWAKAALGLSTTNAAKDSNDLLASCKANLNDARISPPRKYNWWFGTNSDFSWMLGNLP